MNRSILLTSLFSLALLAPIGCAASAPGDESEETVSDSEELTALASQFVGRYFTHAPTFGGFARLELKSSGKYTAKVDGGGTMVCIVAPCVFTENGTWNAYKVSGKLKLRVKPNGKPARIYDLSKFDASIDFTSGIVLKRSGETQTLTKLEANQCLDDGDCSANQECGIPLCLMYCEVNDPSCCGPATCQPKTKEPACCDPATKPPPGIEGVWCCGDGSWQYDIGSGNQTISCSTHGGAGAVCGGEQCGPVTCGAGTECCNPLQGICVPPGGVCAF
jgi:hypothetical protein